MGQLFPAHAKILATKNSQQATSNKEQEISNK
jgi:hypothetical protein